MHSSSSFSRWNKISGF
jgi:hypothetical protein